MAEQTIQTIKWSHGDLVNWLIYTSLGLFELITNAGLFASESQGPDIQMSYSDLTRMRGHQDTSSNLDHQVTWLFF